MAVEDEVIVRRAKRDKACGNTWCVGVCDSWIVMRLCRRLGGRMVPWKLATSRVGARLAHTTGLHRVVVPLEPLPNEVVHCCAVVG